MSNEWTEVGQERIYTPSQTDAGRALRLQATPVIRDDAKDETGRLGPPRSLETSSVIQAPAPPPARQMMYMEAPPHVPLARQAFRAVCYNVLAEIYATRRMYPYTPVWALAWSFRKHNLLRDILAHNAEIVCLQEVQADHFNEFFLPRMKEKGYEGIFKRKTREAIGNNVDAIDGCAIFYKSNRFALNERYGISFNDLARDQYHIPRQLRRLMKGNVALVAVLEDLMPPTRRMAQVRMRKRRLCVANSHIYWDPEFSDVKVWQTLALTQKLEQLTMRRRLPLLICGDFNSMPDSSVYELLTQRSVRSDHAELKNDPTGLLKHRQLRHNLSLSSAYASTIGEPNYTNYTAHFKGTLDYILYSNQDLMPVGVLPVDEEEVLSQHKALPSPQFGSDHVSIAAEFDWIES
eukprot:TRINITY_DN67421_c5_g8_i1.p2 TRINITY_DN67421_c5_g8~~TRINITY_DN67421_c5_g8_i1.p2  ORF type:complete len:455 (-),score=239.47 TRINITY_DN67421_c5_g8_i1:67-1284(-)